MLFKAFIDGVASFASYIIKFCGFLYLLPKWSDTESKGLKKQQKVVDIDKYKYSFIKFTEKFFEQCFLFVYKNKMELKT